MTRERTRSGKDEERWRRRHHPFSACDLTMAPLVSNPIIQPDEAIEMMIAYLTRLTNVPLVLARLFFIYVAFQTDNIRALSLSLSFFGKRLESSAYANKQSAARRNPVRPSPASLAEHFLPRFLFIRVRHCGFLLNISNCRRR